MDPDQDLGLVDAFDEAMIGLYRVESSAAPVVATLPAPVQAAFWSSLEAHLPFRDARAIRLRVALAAAVAAGGIWRQVWPDDPTATYLLDHARANMANVAAGRPRLPFRVARMRRSVEAILVGSLSGDDRQRAAFAAASAYRAAELAESRNPLATPLEVGDDDPMSWSPEDLAAAAIAGSSFLVDPDGRETRRRVWEHLLRGVVGPLIIAA